MSVPGPGRANTWAVIVTFQPDPDIGVLLSAVAPQVRGIIVVDNGSFSDEVRILRELMRAYNGILIENSVNQGIAFAVNQGVACVAQQAGAEWVLLFDQDTRPSPDLLGGLGDLYQRIPKSEDVAVISPNYVASATRLPVYQVNSAGELGWHDVRHAITSGSLNRLTTFLETGGYRDEYFIDFADMDFCLRVRKAGYRVVRGELPLMTHSLGAKTIHKLGRREYIVGNYSAERRYYITRNGIAYTKDNLGFQLAEARFVIRDLLVQTICMILFEKDKLRKMKAVLRGVWDGLRSDFRYSPLSTSLRHESVAQ